MSGITARIAQLLAVVVADSTRSQQTSEYVSAALAATLRTVPQPLLASLDEARGHETAGLDHVVQTSRALGTHLVGDALATRLLSPLDPFLGWWLQENAPAMAYLLRSCGVLQDLAESVPVLDVHGALRVMFDSDSFFAAAEHAGKNPQDIRLSIARIVTDSALGLAINVVLAEMFPEDEWSIHLVSESDPDRHVATAFSHFPFNQDAFPGFGVRIERTEARDPRDAFGFFLRRAPHSKSHAIDWQLVLEVSGGVRQWTVTNYERWQLQIQLPSGFGNGWLALTRGGDEGGKSYLRVGAAGQLPPEIDVRLIREQVLELTGRDSDLPLTLGHLAITLSASNRPDGSGGLLVGAGLVGATIVLKPPRWLNHGKGIELVADLMLTARGDEGLGVIFAPRAPAALSSMSTVASSLSAVTAPQPSAPTSAQRPGQGSPGTPADRQLAQAGFRVVRSERPFGIRIGGEDAGVSVGNVLIELRVLTDGPGLRIDVLADVATKSGPLSLAVTQVGGWGGWWTETKGQDAEHCFAGHPPTGIGIDFRTEAVQGGGYLERQANGGYAGAFAVRVSKFSLAGLAVFEAIDDVPSILVMANVALPSPVPLSMGFELVKIGGVLGMNRRIDLDSMRASVPTGAMGALFTHDIVGGAQQNLPTLKAFFPAKKGGHVFGALARVTWLQVGSGHLVNVDLALAIELPSLARIAIFGTMRVQLPDLPELLQLRLDFAGGIDFTARLLSFDASLIDSQVLDLFQVTGDIAVRLAWGERPGFLFSAGGFHPSYKPELPGIPSLQRLALTLNRSIGNLQVRAEAYFAVTSNTLQAGGKLDVRLTAGGFALWGKIGFDTLVQYAPFRFDVSFDVSLGVAYRGFTLLSLRVHGRVSGPGPLRIQAGIEIDILMFPIEFSHTFVIGGEVAQPAEPRLGLKAAAQQLVQALTRSEAVRGNDMSDPLVVLLIASGASAGRAIVVSPLSPVQVSQDTFPLEVAISRAGGSRFGTDARPVASVGFRATSDAQAGAPPTTSFSPAQYVDVAGEAQRLALPSYESHPSGLTLSSPPVHAPKPETRKLEPLVQLVPTADDVLLAPGFANLRILSMFGVAPAVAQVAVGSPRIAVHDEGFGPIGGSAIAVLGGTALGVAPEPGLFRTDPVTIGAL